jgi:hypothetical protein
MTIPANITTELASLQAQVAAATPLNNAPFTTIKALQLNAAQLVSDVQFALTTTTVIANIVLTTDALLLDTWTAPLDPASIVAGVNAMVTAADNQSDLSRKRGLVGRIASNLDQLV